MPPDAPTLDPHLEEVLADIARDPKARLFMVDPRRLVTGLRSMSRQVSIAQAGLRPAERELLRVHREEVAWLLIEEVRRMREVGQRSAAVDPRPTMASERVADLAGTFLRTDRSIGGARIALDRLLESSGSTSADPTARLALLDAAVQLVDQPSVRAHRLIELVDVGELQTALAEADAILRMRPRCRTATTALQASGAAFRLLGKEDTAVALFRRAAALSSASDPFPEGRCISIIDLIVCAAHRGAGAEVRALDRSISDLPTDVDQYVQTHARAIAMARDRGSRIQADFRSQLLAVRDTCSPRCRLLLRSLL